MSHGHGHGEHGHGHEEHGHSGHGDCGGHGHGHDLEAPLLPAASKSEHGHSHAGQGHSHDCHGHSHGTADLTKTEEDIRKLKTAVYLALFIMFVEIAGGIYCRSLAVIVDAAHMLSDVGGFIISLISLHLSQRAANEDFTYGFKQAEVLGAFLSILIVWAMTAILLYEAVLRFIDPPQIEGQEMFAISVIGFVVNLMLFKVLGHSHSHGGVACNHGDADAGIAVQAAIAHVIGDIVQSLGVCLAASLIWLQPFEDSVGYIESSAGKVSRWTYADPCCTILFGFLVLKTTKYTITFAMDSLMVRAPKNISQAELRKKLTSLPNVDSIHDVHLWCLGSSEVLCTAHVMVNGQSNTTGALQGAIKVAQAMGIGHSTFQVEIVGEFDPAMESYGGLNCCGVQSPKEVQGHGHAHDGHSDHGHAQGHSHDGHGGDCCGGHGDGSGHADGKGHSHDGHGDDCCGGHGDASGHAGGHGHAHGHDTGHSSGHAGHSEHGHGN